MKEQKYEELETRTSDLMKAELDLMKAELADGSRPVVNVTLADVLKKLEARSLTHAAIEKTRKAIKEEIQPAGKRRLHENR